MAATFALVLLLVVVVVVVVVLVVLAADACIPLLPLPHTTHNGQGGCEVLERGCMLTCTAARTRARAHNQS
jgi:hypothetical protein